MTARRAAASPKGLAHTAAPDSGEESWRTTDLPACLQEELSARLIQAERGEGLLPYDEAMAEVERMAEEILAVAPAASR